MNRMWLLMAALACPVLTLAQNAPSGSAGNLPAYRPVVPAPSTSVYGGGGWGGYGGASTAAGSVLSGMSQAISAAGQYNLATSAAAVNMTQAESNAMQNQIQSANTFWELRRIGREQRAAEAGPPPTPEQVARMARAGVPKPLNSSQIDPVTGRLRWPEALQAAGFDADRHELDQIFAKQAAYGGIDDSDRRQVRATTNNMFAGLKSQIRDIPPQTYVDSRKFLESLVYAATATTLD